MQHRMGLIHSAEFSALALNRSKTRAKYYCVTRNGPNVVSYTVYVAESSNRIYPHHDMCHANAANARTLINTLCQIHGAGI